MKDTTLTKAELHQRIADLEAQVAGQARIEAQRDQFAAESAAKDAQIAAWQQRISGALVDAAVVPVPAADDLDGVVAAIGKLAELARPCNKSVNGSAERVAKVAGLDLVTLLVDASFALSKAAPGSVLVGTLERAATKLREANKTDEWHAANPPHDSDHSVCPTCQRGPVLKLSEGGVAQVNYIAQPHIDPKDVFQWTGDLDAFAVWFGQPMPVDSGGQISVSVYRSPTGKCIGPWLRVWCGSWIVRRGEGNGMRHYTFPNEEYQFFIKPHVYTKATPSESPERNSGSGGVCATCQGFPSRCTCTLNKTNCSEKP